MLSGKHLSDEELACFQDGESRGDEVVHVKSCTECRQRLEDLGFATSAFREYLDSVYRPLQPPPPQPWQGLSEIAAQHSSVRPALSFRWIWMTAVAASLAGTFAFVDWKRDVDASERAQDILSQSSRIALPPEGRISIIVGGSTILRPALLETDIDRDPSLERLHRAFDQANYNWREPLSARSFLAWRNRLAKKRDRVNVIGEGSQRAYRVHTENPAGPLKAATLTLQAEEMRPTAGSFEFVQAGTVEISVAGKLPEGVTEKRSQKAGDAPRELPASPEDTLRVLAALHRIGADVEDPISVSEAANRGVIVRGVGLNAERQKAVVEVLRGLPRTTVDFSATDFQDRRSAGHSGERTFTNLPEGIRHKLEERAGGAVALQILTDEVLDASGLLLARVHAVEVLRKKFPPSIESTFTSAGKQLLGEMRRDHAAKIRREIESIQARLKPLLPMSKESSPPEVSRTGRIGTESLGHAVRNLDASLNRLLAGAFNQAEGERLLDQVRVQLQILIAAAQTQEGFPL
jgi:hypothetical protein